MSLRVLYRLGSRQLADQRRMRAPRGAPQLQSGQPAEDEQRLADGSGGADHERALALLHPGRSMQELISGRPAQDQRGRLRRVDSAGPRVTRSARSVQCRRSPR